MMNWCYWVVKLAQDYRSFGDRTILSVKATFSVKLPDVNMTPLRDDLANSDIFKLPADQISSVNYTTLKNKRLANNRE